MTTTSITMITMAIVVLMAALLDAAPLQGGNPVAEEMELANLIQQSHQAQPAPAQPIPQGNMPQTKVLLQKTKIVIPIEDEPATAAPVAPPTAAPRVEEPMRFVDPPQLPIQDFTQEENEFLFPEDYELNSQEPQYQPAYDYGSESELASPDLDLTPRAVAEYLVLTGDFKGFSEALADLMNAGMLSVSQVEQYRAIVSQEYERLMEEMAVAEEVYEQDQQRYDQQYDQQRYQPAQPEPQLLGDELMRDAEASELLQALLQDYMTTENMDVNSQEYEDFLDWMEKFVDTKAEAPMQEDVEAQLEAQNAEEQFAEQQLAEQLAEQREEQREEQSAPVEDVEQELEELPVEEEEESSGDEESFQPLGQLSSTEKKLKKTSEEAAH